MNRQAGWSLLLLSLSLTLESQTAVYNNDNNYNGNISGLITSEQTSLTWQVIDGGSKINLSNQGFLKS